MFLAYLLILVKRPRMVTRSAETMRQKLKSDDLTGIALMKLAADPRNLAIKQANYSQSLLGPVRRKLSSTEIVNKFWFNFYNN